MSLLIVFAVYLLVLAGIGVYSARFNRSLADFVLGGRRLGPWVAAISAQASDMSGWLLVSLPGAAFASGLSALWICVGCAVGTVFNWLVIAPRLRRATGRAGALTIPDYLGVRYGGGVRLAAVAVILLAYAGYIAAQFVAAGKVFETAFAAVDTPWGKGALDYHTGMLVGVAIMVLYTVVGGFMAVAWTDLVQGMLMVATVVALPVVGLIGLGGLPVLWSKLHAAGPALLGVTGGKGAGTAAFLFGVCLANLSWGLGYPGQPHILARFMALRDPRAMRRTAFIAITWVLLAMWGAVFVGLVGRAILGPLGDKEHVMPVLALHLMHPALAGIMIAAAVAAMMSTADSQLLVAASAVEHDVWIRLLGGRPRDRAAVWVGRLTVLALGAAAIPIAWGRQSVFQRVFKAWGMLGAAIGPLVILGLLTRRTNRWGALAGLLVGFGTFQFWDKVKFLFGGDRFFGDGLVPGFCLNLLLACLVSLATADRTR